MPYIQALIDRSETRPYRRSGAFKQYLSALELFWSGQGEKCIAALSQEILAGGMLAFVQFALYRLWLEQLAVDGDRAGLRLLCEHLLTRGLEEPEEISWAALRALAHFELDDWEACQLLAPGLSKRRDDIYCLEFDCRYRLRGWTGQQRFGLALPDENAELADFFFWQTLAETLLASGRREDLDTVLVHIREIYPEAPLVDAYHSHLAIDAADFTSALRPAKALVGRFPLNKEFQVLYAYTQLHLGGFEEALAALRNARRLPGGRVDGDIAALTAYCLRERSAYDIESDDWRRSRALLRRAAELYKASGHPASETHVLAALARRQEAAAKSELLKADEISGLDFRAWAVHLSPRRACELATLDEEESDILIRPFGAGLKGDDLVFFVYEQAGAPAEEGSRVVALYHALGKAFWHPYLGQVAALKLVRRFREPLLVQLDPRDCVPAHNRQAQRHRRVEGTYCLGEKSFDSIQAAVNELAVLGEAGELERYFARSS